MARIDGTVGKNGYSFYAELIETIPSDYITTNRTNYSLRIYIKNGNMRFNSNNWKKYLKVDGVECYNETGQNINSTVVGYGEAFSVMAVDAGVPHNADGTYTVSIEASLSKSSYGTYDPGYCYLKGDIPLTTIPRTSSVTATDGYINDGNRPVNIHINTTTTAFTHTLRYTFGGLSGTIADKYQYLDYGWTLPTTFYSQIPNNPSGTGTIYCDTYNGDALIGTSSVNFTAYIDESSNKPVVSVTAVDTNKTLPTGYTTQGLTDSAYIFIKNVSNAQVTVNATAQNSASIVSYQTANNSKVYNSSTFTVENIEDANFNATAVDSRGFPGSGTKTVSMVNYVPLTVNHNIYRPEPTTGEVKLEVNGNYFSGSFGKLNNSLELKYRYKESTASWDNVAYKTLTATIDSTNNKYSVSLSLGTGFDYQKKYDFEIVATDKIKNVSSTYRVSEGIAMFGMFKDHLEAFGHKLTDNNGFLYLDHNCYLNNYHSVGILHSSPYTNETFIGAENSNIIFRPNTMSSVDGQMYITPSGDVIINGLISLQYNRGITYNNKYAFRQDEPGNTIIASNNNSIIFRPVGSNDTTGQVYINTVGDLACPTGAVYANSFRHKDNYDLKAVLATNVHQLNMVSNPYLEIMTDDIGGITTFGVTVWTSDKRLKNSICNSSVNALDIIRQIKHREFVYNHSNEFVKIGYVADELQEIDESLIFEVGKDKLKQPRESVIIPILSKAIQEQQDYIEKLEERIKKLEDIIKDIE